MLLRLIYFLKKIEKRVSIDLPPEDLQGEINTLVSIVGDLQSEKWKLEERVGNLEEHTQLLAQELEKKDTILKNHVLSTKVEGRATMEMDVHKQERSKKGGVMGSLFRGKGSELASEVTQKMETVLSETLLKNIQLQVKKYLILSKNLI
jgi:hypothetical protein